MSNDEANVRYATNVGPWRLFWRRNGQLTDFRGEKRWLGAWRHGPRHRIEAMGNKSYERLSFGIGVETP